MSKKLTDWSEGQDGRMAFYRVLVASCWACSSLLVLLPIVWVVLMPLFDHEGSAAICALGVVIVGGILGYAATMTLIRRAGR